MPRTPQEIVERSLGFSISHVHTNEAGEEVRVPMMPTHVPEAIIPDDHRTNMINGAGITIFLIGIAGIVNYGTEFAAKFVNNEQRIDSLFSLIAAGFVMAAGYALEERAAERKEAAALFNNINQGTAVFESSNPPQP